MAEGTRKKLFVSSYPLHFLTSAEANYTVLVRHIPNTLKNMLKKIWFSLCLCFPIFSIQCFKLIPPNLKTFPYFGKFSRKLLSILAVTMFWP